MKIVILLSLRYMYEDGLADVLKLPSPRNPAHISGMTETDTLPEVTEPTVANNCLVLLAETTVKQERWVRLLATGTDPILWVFHWSEKQRLRNYFTRMATQFPARNIMYCYQHSDAGIGTEILHNLARAPGQRAALMRAQWLVLEDEALRALRSDFVKSDNFLHIHQRFLGCDDKATPWLWCRFFERFPDLPSLLRDYVTHRNHPTRQQQIRNQIEDYTVLDKLL